nr:hypothetical protein [Tanacetum cinerariifolium]
MSSLFADTHNVVAILEKSDAAEDFEQIIDFLNDATRLQALVNRKKIMISEDVIREILQLDDAKSVNQVGDLSTHTTRFISPALTQKVFANMRWVGKGFSRVETSLFAGMLAARQLTEEGIAEEQVQADDAVVA